MQISTVPCAVLTISDTRTEATDVSGRTIRSLLTEGGHAVMVYEILKDDPDSVRDRVMDLCDSRSCQAVLLTGGTGLSPRDSTYEAVACLLEKRIDGFGEIFRMLSFAEIGSAAMLSRAVAGIRNQCAVFSMPGSAAAVTLAMKRLILPELGHLIWLVNPFVNPPSQ